jgi:hypothetical protein
VDVIQAPKPEPLLADRGYDADWIRELARQQGAWANIPPKRNRKDPDLLQPLSLSRTQTGRTVLQQDQAMSVSRPDTTSSQSTIWRSSNLHQSESGYALMSLRPNFVVGGAWQRSPESSGETSNASQPSPKAETLFDFSPFQQAACHSLRIGDLTLASDDTG